MSNFYLQGGTGGSLCPSLFAPRAGEDLLRRQGDARWQLNTIRMSLLGAQLPMGCHRLCCWEGLGNFISCACQKWSQVFFWICCPSSRCVCEGERGRFLCLCCPVLIPVWKNCWCFVLFSLSRWAEEGSRGIWHRHGRARDRAGGRGDTVPVQKIPEEKSGVPVLVATSQLKTK